MLVCVSMEKPLVHRGKIQNRIIVCLPHPDKAIPQ